MKEDTGWYAPTWANLYFTKAVYDFIWKAHETFGDEEVTRLRHRIRSIIWELLLFLISVPVVTFLLILAGAFR